MTSSTSITGGSCDITDATAGTWNVVVTNTDTGTDSLVDGFTVTSSSYSLRDIGPAGGYIFYINPNYATDGWRYLEAAPSAGDTTTIKWSNITTAIGTTGTAIGTGKTNTEAILAQAGFTDGAAKNCDNFSVNGYDDWFLPSQGELELMYDNLRLYSVGNFSIVSPASYWSSSEVSATNAYRHKFDSDIQDSVGKTSPYKYRPVRRF